MPNREEALRRIFEATGVQGRLTADQQRELLAHVEDAVEAIRGNDELRMFLARMISGVTNEATAHASVEASLDLAAFGLTNGPYKLKQPEFSIRREDNGITASAHAAVFEPDRGEISVTIHFNAAGAIEPDTINIASSTHPGSPPR